MAVVSCHIKKPNIKTNCWTLFFVFTVASEVEQYCLVAEILRP